MRSNTANILIGLASGLVAGVAGTLLLASMRGSEARGRVRDAISKAGRGTREEAKARSQQPGKSMPAAARRAKRRMAAKLERKPDLNTATRDELTQLEGIGPSSAEEIVKYREAHGGFKNVEELDEVYGFGEVMARKVRDQVYVSETPEAMSI